MRQAQPQSAAKNAGHETPERNAMRILLAVDGSKHTRRSARYLVRYAGALREAPEILVATFHPPLPYRAKVATVVGKRAIDDYYREQSEAALSAATRPLTRAGLEHEAIWQVADPATGILELADARKVDLIMVGSRGHGQFSRLVLGSISAKVLAGSKVPVLVVP
jgi:nucleotide-binding universal stress UspA family protein